jgi:alpha-glucosidase
MMRELVDHLHANNQHYILLVNPGVGYHPYPSFERGVADDIFLRRNNGSIWQGVVWPGITAFPDWFAASISRYWHKEVSLFFSPTGGVDIDGLWIDMNEPSVFPCNFPCDDPVAVAVGFPPDPPTTRSPPRVLPGWSCDFQPAGAAACNVSGITESISPPEASLAQDILFGYKMALLQRQEGEQLGLPGRDLLYPRYAIHNKAAYEDSWNSMKGGISNHTANTDLIHQNGLTMYDVCSCQLSS